MNTAYRHSLNSTVWHKVKEGYVKAKEKIIKTKGKFVKAKGKFIKPKEIFVKSKGNSAGLRLTNKMEGRKNRKWCFCAPPFCLCISE